MMNQKKKVASIMLSLSCIALVLSGCGSSANNGGSNNASTNSSTNSNTNSSTNSSTSTNNTSSNSSNTAPAADAATDPSTLPPVELTYYFPNTPQKDLQAVEDELNRLVKPKINATIHLKLIDWNAYDEKMNVIMSSGEPYDLAFTSTWSNNYFQDVAKNAFVPLDDLVTQYAPDLKTIVPDPFWKSVTVKGHVYGIPNFQQATAGYGYEIRKSIADKYNIDWKSVKSLADLTPILETVKKNEPDLVPWRWQDAFLNGPAMFGMEALGDSKTPGAIYLNDTSMKVVDQFETPEFKDYVNLMHDWYTKGYIMKDAVTRDPNADLKAGKVALQMGQIDLDSNDFFKVQGEYPAGRMAGQNPAAESYDYRFVAPLLTTDKAAATMTAISATSPNKERAMMFINLLNTDKEIYNVLDWGVEGKHYKKIGDNQIELAKDSGYLLWSGWEFGYMGNSYYLSTDKPAMVQNDTGNKMWEDLNKNATQSNALGFVFDFTPVKSEKANCDAVIAELEAALASGSVDPAKYLPKFIEKLKAAGSDKILAEKQKQLDAWKAENGK